MRPVLVTGFGAFLNVTDNPSARLARAVDGAVLDGVPVVGRVLPVTYDGAPSQAIALARELDARLVIGSGVARGRKGVWVEAVGRRTLGGTPDVEGATPLEAGEGPDLVACTVDAAGLAELLGASVSQDAGGYVCNAWAWHVPQKLDVPAVFLHLPDEGLDPERLLQAIRGLLDARLA